MLPLPSNFVWSCYSLSLHCKMLCSLSCLISKAFLAGWNLEIFCISCSSILFDLDIHNLFVINCPSILIVSLSYKSVHHSLIWHRFHHIILFIDISFWCTFIPIQFWALLWFLRAFLCFNFMLGKLIIFWYLLTRFMYQLLRVKWLLSLIELHIPWVTCLHLFVDIVEKFLILCGLNSLHLTLKLRVWAMITNRNRRDIRWGLGPFLMS